MAEPLTIARPYAEAAFQLATEAAPTAIAAELAAWSEALNGLAAVAATPTALELFSNPALTAPQVAQTMLEVVGAAPGPLHGFVQLLAANERLAVLPEIAALFDQLSHAHEGIVDAKVTSAFAMSEAQVAAVVALLTQRHGRPVKVSVDVDPELIGGVSIRIGDEVTDLSVRGKLSQLASALMN
jgi:F-type H+-transporting ATPase subunit delta